jgi:hypothetical protein
MRRFVERKSSVSKTLVQDWSEPMGHYRFLHNDQVTGVRVCRIIAKRPFTGG